MVLSLEAFRQGLKELGYVDGQSITIEYRFGGDRLEDLPALAAELVRLKVDIIVAAETPAIRPARSATTTIPIVFPVAGDPVATGDVDSLARPGRNVTGLSILAPELGGKRVQLLKEVVPGLSRLAVLWVSENPYAGLVLRETEVAARTVGVHLQPVMVQGPAEFEKAFLGMVREHADALIVMPYSMLYANRTQVVSLAAKSRLPSISPWREYVEAGGLMGYGPSIPDMYRRAATYVDKILKGAKPANLPIEQPTTFELVINLNTAKVLGLTIPPSLLRRADAAIQ
jgi:putative tryptophan/tyrosine transport system substrate-binding protein